MGQKYIKDMVLCGGDGLATTTELGLDCAGEDEEIRVYRF